MKMKKLSLGTCFSAMMLAATVSVTSCIDEDLSKCGSDYKIVYKMNLRTNMETEIDQTLTTPEEQLFAETLKKSMTNVFSDYAHDNDLSFFVNGTIFHHEQNKMQANTASYTIYLKRQDYRHLALANTEDEKLIEIKNGEHAKALALEQIAADTIDSHRYGIFTARRDISDNDFGTDIDVNLYMQNCAAAVVVDRRGHDIEDIYGYVENMATGFAVSDSVYHTERNTAIRARRITATDGSRAGGTGFEGLTAVCFPSTTDSWKYTVVVKKEGKYTKNVLNVNTPLKAGQLKILKMFLKEDGSLTATDNTVGVSVELNWKPGGQHDIEI